MIAVVVVVSVCVGLGLFLIYRRAHLLRPAWFTAAMREVKALRDYVPAHWEERKDRRR